MTATQREAVDFYSGHKETITYLGTIWVVDGSPEGIQARKRFSDEGLPDDTLFVESDYLDAVQIMIDDGGGDTWPHSYRNSIESPWSYRYQSGTVHIYQGGYLVGTLLCNGARSPYDYFPNMATSPRASKPS